MFSTVTLRLESLARLACIVWTLFRSSAEIASSSSARVTSPDPDWLGGLIPEADRIVPGLGESLIAGLIEDPMGVGLGSSDLDLLLVTDSVEEAMTHIEKHAIEPFGLQMAPEKSAELGE